MIVWIFTILDGIAIVSLSLLHFGMSYPLSLLLISGLYLIGKAAAFRDFMSIIDGVCGIYILIATLFQFHSFFYWLVLIWFFYKFGSLWAAQQ